jgi:hypothetical protein
MWPPRAGSLPPRARRKTKLAAAASVARHDVAPTRILGSTGVTPRAAVPRAAVPRAATAVVARCLAGEPLTELTALVLRRLRVARGHVGIDGIGSRSRMLVDVVGKPKNACERVEIVVGGRALASIAHHGGGVAAHAEPRHETLPEARVGQRISRWANGPGRSTGVGVIVTSARGGSGYGDHRNSPKTEVISEGSVFHGARTPERASESMRRFVAGAPGIRSDSGFVDSVIDSTASCIRRKLGVA